MKMEQPLTIAAIIPLQGGSGFLLPRKAMPMLKPCGIIYEEGHGVTQDFAAAVTWYRRAADQGHPDAQFYLACMHDFGKGVPLDSIAAAQWLTKAADQGHTDAQF
jgi:hypothetical protein